MNAMLEKGVKILTRLQDHGYQAYFVGGAVRDFLLKRPIQDVDITTDAEPSQIEALFEKTIQTGAAFGTITVLIEKTPYEVTTYRKETKYDNHRHPSELTFTKSLEEDLSRRDFTINQLVMDKDGRIYDYYNGKAALSQHVIETIGNPVERFEEDALRMMRAFRFKAQLNFTIAKATLAAIKENHQLLNQIAIERIQDELFKLLDAPYTKAVIADMTKTKVLSALSLTQAFACLKTLDKPYGALEAFTVFYIHNTLELEQFRLSNKHIKTMKDTKQLHEATAQDSFKPKHIFDFGSSACLFANRINVLLGYADQQALIETLNQNLTLHKKSDLAINGKDLLQALNIDYKPHIAMILEALIHKVLDRDIPNQKSPLINEAKKIHQTLKASE